MPWKTNRTASITNKQSQFGIMGGLANRRTSGASSNRATNRLVIPRGAASGFAYMKMHGILSRNPLGSGGVGKVVKSKPCHCKGLGKTKVEGGDLGGTEYDLLDTTSDLCCNNVSNEKDLLACAASGEVITVTGDISINRSVTFNKKVSINNGLVTFNKDVTINEKSTMYIRQNDASAGAIYVNGGDFVLKGTIDVSGYDLSFSPFGGAWSGGWTTVCIGPSAESYTIDASGKMLFTSVTYGGSRTLGAALPPAPFYIGNSNIHNNGVIKYSYIQSDMYYIAGVWLGGVGQRPMSLGSITSNNKFDPTDWANKVLNFAVFVYLSSGEAVVGSYTITDGSGITWDSSNCTPCAVEQGNSLSFGCLIDSSHCCTAIDSSSNCVDASHVCMWDFSSNKPLPDTKCWEGRDFSLCGSVLGIEYDLLDTTSDLCCNNVSNEKDLLACAASGEVITVTGDISINSPVTFNKEVSINNGLVTFNKDVTINEKSTMYIRQNDASAGAIYVNGGKFLLKGTIDVSGYDLSFSPFGGAMEYGWTTVCIGQSAESYTIDASGKMLFTSVTYGGSRTLGWEWDAVPFFIGNSNIHNNGVIKYSYIQSDMYYILGVWEPSWAEAASMSLGSITSNNKFDPTDWANKVLNFAIFAYLSSGEAVVGSYTITDGSGITWDSSNCTPCGFGQGNSLSFGCLIDSSHCCTAIDSSSNCVNAERVCMWDYPSNKPLPDTKCWEGRDFSLCDATPELGTEYDLLDTTSAPKETLGGTIQAKSSGISCIDLSNTGVPVANDNSHNAFGAPGQGYYCCMLGSDMCNNIPGCLRDGSMNRASMVCVSGCEDIPCKDVVDISNVGKWKSIADMTTARMALGLAATSNGKIYAVGGIDVSVDIAGSKIAPPLKTAEVYDPKLDKWRSIADMSTARTALGLAVIDDKIYAVGGSGDDGNRLKSAEMYDPSTNTWTDISFMTTVRDAFGLASLKRKLYAVGVGDVARGALGVEVYDPDTKLWTTSIISGLNYITGIAAIEANDVPPDMRTQYPDGLLYVVGISGDAMETPAAGYYNPSSQHPWTSLAPPTATGQLQGFGMESLNGKLYIAGGWLGTTAVDLRAVGEAMVGDISSTGLINVTNLLAMNAARAELGVGEFLTASAGKLYVVGGGKFQSLGGKIYADPLNTGEVYTPYPS